MQAKDDLKRPALPSLLLLFLPFLPALLEVGIELSAVRPNIRAVGTRGMIAPPPTHTHKHTVLPNGVKVAVLDLNQVFKNGKKWFYHDLCIHIE